MEIQQHYNQDSLEWGAQGRREREIGVGSFTSDEDVEHVESSRGTISCGDLERHCRGARIWKISVYLVTIGMLAALLAGLSLPWTAITAAVVMMMLDFSDVGPTLHKVLYALLVFFSGMFIATSGFNATVAPKEFWTSVEPHSRSSTVSGVNVFSLVVTVLSNVASNVPRVILLGPRVAASAEGTAGASSEKAWLIPAWVSTVAGNLTLVGSAANLIVCEQARPTPADKALREGQSKDRQNPDRPSYNLTFWEHLKFGFPSTLIVNAAMISSKAGMFLFYVPAALLASVFLAYKVGLLPLALILESFGAFGAASFLDKSLAASDDRLLLVAAALFIHFIKRVLEVVFVHKFSGSTSVGSTALVATSYASQVGFLLYSQLLSAGFEAPSPDLKWLGVALFLIGITANAYHHWMLSHLRKDGNKKYVVPRGGLFDLLVCPHYVFEMVDLAGIALISQTLFGWCIAWFVIFYLTGRAIQTKQWYMKKVEGFPEDRSTHSWDIPNCLLNKCVCTI